MGPVRPVLLVPLALALALAAFMVVRNNASEPAPAPPAEEPPAVEPEAAVQPSEAAPAGGDASGTASGTQRASAAGAKPAPELVQQLRQGPAVPDRVARALADRLVVAVTLWEPRGADDVATVRQVRELEAARQRRPRLRKHVSVFTDRLQNAGEYVGVTGSLQVGQAPAVVILSPSGEARLLEGYTDGRSLRQHLTDALE
jgi:hypothetical protein